MKLVSSLGSFKYSKGSFNPLELQFSNFASRDLPTELKC